MRACARADALFGLVLAGVAGCRAPTLWVGTARSLDGGAGLGAAGDGVSTSQLSAAGAGGADEPSGGAPEQRVPQMSSPQSSDAGLQRMAADAGAPAKMSPQVDVGTQDADADGGSDSEPTDSEGQPPRPRKLPSTAGQCPDMNGRGAHTFSAGGRSLLVDIYMRPDAKSLPAPGGPLVLYFHSVGDSSGQVTQAFTQAAIDAVVAQGGVVASFNSMTCLRCGLAEDVVWYEEDDVVTDQVVACAIEKAQIDTRRIHSLGFSAGALRSMHLAVARSDYIASVLSYSGGTPQGSLMPQDPANKVSALLSFGAEGIDNTLVDFNLASHDWNNRFGPRGYYSLMCNHGGGHVIPREIPAVALRFFLDHPYGASPEPYVPTIPGAFPSYCRNVLP